MSSRNMTRAELDSLIEGSNRRRWPSIFVCYSESPSLETVQGWIGEPGKTTVELIKVRYRIEGEEAQMYVDEDGLTKGLPENPVGTVLMDEGRYPGQRVFGRVVILAGDAKWT